MNLTFSPTKPVNSRRLTLTSVLTAAKTAFASSPNASDDKTTEQSADATESRKNSLFSKGSPTPSGSSKPSKAGSLWWAILGFYLLMAAIFSIIQPIGRAPDEAAHMQYVGYLANHKSFPIWQADGGGEAGYEAQHPPLYYALMAVPYQLSSPLEERWSWHIVRWATILVGLALFFVCRRGFTDLFPNNQRAALVATATVLWMPLTILYTSHVNPDGLTALWVTLAFVIACRIARGDESNTWKQSALLGFVCGLALLTKLSSAPIVIVAVAAHLIAGRTNKEQSGLKNIGVTLLALAVTCGWWYLRNISLYGNAFIHTEGKLGTGLQNAARTSFGEMATLTWRETYLSTWLQRGWLPDGFWSFLLYGLVIAMSGIALFGLIARKATLPASPSPAVRLLSAALVLLIFLGQ
jgi:hypothetical protein